uniref:Uncharacterized protein n=1 Tax=Anopheles coluzzii TaxID=1518534 RepID=A0A6E8VSG4_ANOCL
REREKERRDRLYRYLCLVYSVLISVTLFCTISRHPSRTLSAVTRSVLPQVRLFRVPVPDNTPSTVTTPVNGSLPPAPDTRPPAANQRN